MPTINQLIRIERKAVVKRKKTPALQACPQRPCAPDQRH